MISTDLVMLSVCTGNCNFTYLDSSVSPNLTSISTSSANAQNVTLTGTNFTNGGTFTICMVSLTNAGNSSDVLVLPTLSCNDTSAVFTVLRNISSGSYIVRLRNDIGETNG